MHSRTVLLRKYAHVAVLSLSWNHTIDHTAVEKGNEKKQALADALKQVLARVDAVGGDAEVAEKIDFLYLKGRAHNVRNHQISFGFPLHVENCLWPAA